MTHHKEAPPMNRWLLTALMLLTLTGSAFAQSQQVQDMGGWYRNPQSGDVTTSAGSQKVHQMNRQSDDNTTILLWSGDVGPRTTVTSSYADLRKFKDIQLHIDWADSLKTGGSEDSLLVRIIPIGKISQSNDGFDYYVGTVSKGAATDTSAIGYGFVVGSPLNLRAANWIGAVPFYPTWIRTPSQTTGVAATYVYTYAVSIPLGNVLGKSFYEDILGFQIQNIGGNVNGKSIAHSLTLTLVAKAN